MIANQVVCVFESCMKVAKEDDALVGLLLPELATIQEARKAD